MAKVSLHAFIYGHVQGVYFRAFVESQATSLELTGWVRNVETAEAVEVLAEGEKEAVDKLLAELKIGPPHSRVDRIETNWAEFSGQYQNFQVKYF